MGMKSCCCCLNLRQGSLGSAIYSIVLSLIVIIFAGVMIANINQKEETTKNSYTLSRLNARLHGDVYDAARLRYYIAIGVYTVWLITALLIILAARQRSRWFLMPWIIFTSILVILMAWNLISMITQIGTVFSDAGLTVQFILSIVMLLINLYCLICVASYFREMPLEDQQPVSVGFKA